MNLPTIRVITVQGDCRNIPHEPTGKVDTLIGSNGAVDLRARPATLRVTGDTDAIRAGIF